MKNVRWLKLLALALLLSEPICKLAIWCQRHFTGHQIFNTEIGWLFYPMAVIAYILALVFQYGVVLLTQALKPKAIVRYVGILVLLTLCCSLAALVIL